MARRKHIKDNDEPEIAARRAESIATNPETHRFIKIIQDDAHLLYAEYNRSEVRRWLAEFLVLLQFVDESGPGLGRLARVLPKIKNLFPQDERPSWAISSFAIEGSMKHSNSDREDFFIAIESVLHDQSESQELAKDMSGLMALDRPRERTWPHVLAEAVGYAPYSQDSDFPAPRWLRAVSEKRSISKRAWSEVNKLARQAEEYVSKSFGLRLHKFMEQLLLESLLYASGQPITKDILRALDRHADGRVFRSLPMRGPGRSKNTGWFRSADEFLTALKEVMKSFPKRPTQLEVLKALDDHPLCARKPTQPRVQSHTKLLRDWLHKANVKNYAEAIGRYHRRSGK